MIKISPSLLSCDFANVAAELKSMEAIGADMLHLDIMDGHFVPNISFGFPVLEAIRKNTKLPLDVHLMIDEPNKYIDRFAAFGSDIITFHLEATEDALGCISKIKSHGKKAGISIKPKTPAEALFPHLKECDMVLVMTVEPGFGGQSIILECLEKVKKIKAEAEKQGIAIDIQVDGGINEATAKHAIEAGANILVAGSAIFNSNDRKQAIENLRK